MAYTRTKPTGETNTLGSRVRAARRERGLSQAQLAGEELTKGFISQLESGLVRPSVRSLQIIAGRLGKSLDYFLGDEPLSLRKRAEFFHLAASAAFERRAWSELEAVVESALAIEPEPRDRARFARWRAHARLGLGDVEGAFAAAEEALRSLSLEADAADAAWAMLVQGVAYVSLGQLLPAAQTFERALQVVERQELIDVRLRARLLINLATTYRRLGRSARAVQLYEAALAIANRASDMREVAQAFMGVAVALYDGGEFDAAIANYRRALELFQRLADQELELDVLQSLAAVRFQQGKVAEAEEYARQAYDRARSVGHERMAAVAQGELARVALARGDTARALELGREAERTLETAGDARQRASVLRTIGAAHHARGEHAKADARYRAAIALAESIKMWPDVSEYAAEYAQKLRERGEYEQAFSYLEMATARGRVAG